MVTDHGVYMTKGEQLLFNEAGYVIRQGHTETCGVASIWNALNYFGKRPGDGVVEYYKFWGELVRDGYASPEGSVTPISVEEYWGEHGYLCFRQRFDAFDDLKFDFLCGLAEVSSKHLWNYHGFCKDPLPDYGAHLVFVERVTGKRVFGYDTGNGRRSWDKQHFLDSLCHLFVVMED